jgi:DNA-binding CsgD family transcriptional regulator
LEKLSPREREVIAKRAQGLAFKQLAGDMGISIHTAKHHAGRAFEKLQVQCSLQAALYFRPVR